MPQYNRNSLSTLLKHPWTLWSLALGGFSFVVFLTLMPMVNVGYADSDALLTVGYKGGLAHPPGYPLYTRLLYLFTHLPLFDSVAARGHLLSVVLSTIAIILSAITLGIYFNRYHAKAKKSLIPYLSSLALVLGLLLNRQFVTYSIVTEKYAFSALGVSATLLILIVLLTTSAKRFSALLLATAFIYGLSLSHHQSLLALIVPITYVLYLKKSLITPKLAVISVATLLVTFAAPFLIAFAIAKNPPEVSWYTEPSVDGLVGLITRREFSGILYQRGENIGAYWSGLNLNGWMNSGINYFSVLFFQNGIVITLLLAISILRYLKIPKPKATLIGITALSQGLLLAAYLTWPTDWGSQANTLRQYVPGFIPVVMFAALSLPFLYTRLTQTLKVLFTAPVTLTLTLLILITPLFAETLVKLPSYSLKNFDLVARRYQSILEDTQENALITCYSDTGCFGLLYEHYVNNTRPDVDIVPLAYPLVQPVLDKPGMRHFTYEQNPYLFFDIVSWNEGKRPLYAVELNDYYYSFYDLDFPFIYYLPMGMMGQLTRTLPDEIPTPPSTLIQEWLAYPVNRHDPMQLHLKSQVARDHIINGSMYLKMDLRERSQVELNHATNLFFQYGQEEQHQITVLKTQVEKQLPLEAFAPGSTVLSSDTLLGYIPGLMENRQNSRALKAAFGAVFIEPTNVEARLALAGIYERMNDYFFATLEYQNVLIIDPDNETAQNRLKAIQTLTL
jgi:hypothetical protein